MPNRMRVILATAVTSITALLSVNSLAAQTSSSSHYSPRVVQVVVSGGVTVPSGDLKNYHDNGFHYDGSLIFNIPGFPIALRPELSLTTFKLKKELLPTGVSEGYGNDQTKLLAGIGNIEIPLAAGLYLIGGVGAANLQSNLNSATTTDSTQTKLLIDAGAGLRFHMSKIEGFVEARMGSASYEQKKFGYAKAQFIPITFGLAF